MLNAEREGVREREREGGREGGRGRERGVVEKDKVEWQGLIVLLLFLVIVSD